MTNTYEHSGPLPAALRLGNLRIAGPFFQGALSGYTDRAMRTIAREHGASLTFAGLMLDKVTLHPPALEKGLFRLGEDEHPVGGQLLGSDPEMMAAAAGTLVEMGFDLVDLNFACPAPKIIRKARGGYLLNNPERVIAIFRRVRQAVACPVTLKLRIGVSDTAADREAFWQVCRSAAAEGIDGLLIHGRTVEQNYRGRAEWETVSQVKREFPGVAVMGSGDIDSAETACRRLGEHRLDGISVARAAIGNPWIFQELRARQAGTAEPPGPDLGEQGAVMLRHFAMMRELYPPYKAVINFRKISIRYAKRHPQRRLVHTALLKAGTPEEVVAAVKNWYPV